MNNYSKAFLMIFIMLSFALAGYNSSEETETRYEIQGYMIIHDYSPLFKHTNKSIHNKKLNSFKMSYDNFLQESGLFKMIYKSTKNKTLVKKKHDLKKFKSDEISLSLYQKIDFIKTYPENI